MISSHHWQWYKLDLVLTTTKLIFNQATVPSMQS